MKTGTEKRPYVVAIAGGTCSGKSTLAAELARELGETKKLRVLNMDSYYKKNPPSTIAPISGKEYVEHNHPDALELARLYEDLRAAAEEDLDLLLIEGLFALYLPEIRAAADLKVFVDLPSDERLVRRVIKHRQWDTEEKITARYLDTVRFRHNELVEPSRWHADVVVNGNFREGKGLAVLKTWLEAACR